MEITWYGHSCFRITERNMASVVTDPFDHTAVGYRALKLKADIVTVSHDEPAHNFVKAVKGAKWQITGAGEYEIGGVFLTAVPTGKQNNKNNSLNMSFVFDYDGVNLAHLGAIKAVPSRKEVEAFGNVDVLLVPVGGGSSLSAAKAAEVVNLIEPGIVIPMYYSTPDTSIDLNDLSAFLKQMGLGSEYEEQESLKVNKRDIPQETRVIVLSYKKSA
jgi:L-ascorbate metabolism protein UlaG (beta-lactamase superfamily)